MGFEDIQLYYRLSHFFSVPFADCAVVGVAVLVIVLSLRLSVGAAAESVWASVTWNMVNSVKIVPLNPAESR